MDDEVSLFFFFVFVVSSNVGDTMRFLRSAPECQSDVNSNKRGCGTLVKAQAPARVDVPTALFFLQCGPRSPTRVQVFVRMLEYVLVRQPIVILRVPAT